MAKKLISIATLFVLMAVSVFSAFAVEDETKNALVYGCLLYTSPSPRDRG